VTELLENIARAARDSEQNAAGGRETASHHTAGRSLAMTGDDPKGVEFPKAQVSPEEGARRLRTDVDRLANPPVAEWMYVFDGGVDERHGLSPAAMKTMVEATIRANDKKAREDKAADRHRIRRVGEAVG
jgi:hypothetical protein